MITGRFTKNCLPPYSISGFIPACFDSANRLRLFAEDDALTDYVASFRTVAPAAIFVGDGQQFNNQHMNQTLVLAAFE